MTPSNRYRPIAVGVDFSEHAEPALAHAAALAAARDVALVLIHVAPDAWPVLGPAGSLSVEAARRELNAETDQALSRLADRVRRDHPELDVRRAHVDGRATRDLAPAAVDAGAGLLVVGTHGRTGIGRFIMGSVAERTVRDSEVDVLVARGDGAPPYRRVLVAFDFSEPAAAAMDRAIEAVAADGAIHVLHAVDQLLPTPPEGSPATTAAWYEEVFDAAERKAGEELARWRKRFAEVSLSCVTGAASTAIQDELGRSDYDLLCIGSHGRSGVKRWLLGSVAETTVRHASVPVLVAKQ